MKCVFRKVSIYKDIHCMSSGEQPSTDGHIVRSESGGSTWRCLEHGGVINED